MIIIGLANFRIDVFHTWSSNDDVLSHLHLFTLSLSHSFAFLCCFYFSQPCRLVVSQNQRALHIVFQHQFLDSPEWFGVSTDDYFQVNVTYKHSTLQMNAIQFTSLVQQFFSSHLWYCKVARPANNCIAQLTEWIIPICKCK